MKMFCDDTGFFNITLCHPFGVLNPNLLNCYNNINPSGFFLHLNPDPKIHQDYRVRISPNAKYNYRMYKNSQLNR